jgi:hypothetical protein
MTSGLGATHYMWRPDCERVVRAAEKRFPRTKANTYYGHPFPGWGHQSADFWGVGGRGDSIPEHTGELLLDWLMELEWGPNIRHTIFRHSLWTSFGGYSPWPADDHSGALRHVHVTWW